MILDLDKHPCVCCVQVYKIGRETARSAREPLYTNFEGLNVIANHPLFQCQ